MELQTTPELNRRSSSTSLLPVYPTASETPFRNLRSQEEEENNNIVDEHGPPVPESKMMTKSSTTERRPCCRNRVITSLKGVTFRKLSPPTTMMLCLVSGISLAIGHHSYYLWLDGKTVGSASKQQWSLRVGNLFAIAVAFSLKTAIGSAYWQCLGCKLKQKYISLGTLDDAFGAVDNIFSLANKKLLKELRAAAALALIAWCIPIVSIFPPATLSVVAAVRAQTADFEVWQPAISYPGPKTGYSTLLEGQSSRNLFQTLISWVAFTGQIPSPKGLSSTGNYSYHLQTFIPRFRCTPPNTEIVESILNASSVFLGNEMALPHPSISSQTLEFATSGIQSGPLVIQNVSGILFYFAMAPTRARNLNRLFNNSDTNGGYGVLKPELLDQDSSYLDGSITMTMARSEGVVEMSNCQLFNTSILLGLKFENDRAGDVQILNMTDIAPITDFIHNENDDQQAANTPFYSFFKEVASLCLGSWYSSELSETASYTNTSTTFNYTYRPRPSHRASVIPQDTVLGQSQDLSSALRYYCDHTNASCPVDQTMVRNQSFAEILEKLSINVSVAVLSQPSLCRKTNVTGDIWTVQNVYSYHFENTIITYSIAISVSFAAVLAGFFAFRKHRIDHNNKLSTIGGFMQNPELFEVLKKDTGGPIRFEASHAVGKTKLKLGKYTVKERAGNCLREVEYFGFILESGQNCDLRPGTSAI